MTNENDTALIRSRQSPWVVALWLGLATTSWAGGGPENVLLVVNRNRVDSMTIANHYASLRQIPASNILYLDYQGRETDNGIIPIARFRRDILEPVFDEISRRKLAQQVDYIIYSSGFPFAIDFRGDMGGEKPHQYTGIRGSITGMTYLSQFVRASDTRYLFTPSNQRNNYYQSMTTQGFRSEYSWDNQAARSSTGHHYYLSVMLGYTDGRGNTVGEIIDYLQRAALADGSRPQGTIYLMKVEGEIRSQTRDPLYPHVATAIQQLGVNARVMPGVLPTGQHDIMGAMLGRAVLHWDRANCTIQPGAIIEHLTSYGGDLNASASQTPFTETLRYGAAGSCGTVMEPYNLLAKFPHPWLQVHYVQGASLAEAFYQSIASPYQILIGGDPLCRPWARIPQVAVDGLRPEQTVTGTVEFTPRPASPVPIAEFRLYVDGRFIRACPLGESLKLDTTKVADGYHEIRVVAIEDSAVESQGRLIIPITVDNHSRRILSVARPNVSSLDERVRLHVESPKARTIYVFHNRNLVGRVNGPKGEVAVGAEFVGRGPIQLTAVAVDAKKAKVFAKPVSAVIQAEGGSPLGNLNRPVPAPVTPRFVPQTPSQAP